MSDTPEPPEWDDREYELVMPFVSVSSKGGPYSDESFTAGFQAGEISGKLSERVILATTFLIYSELISQVDLIAMRYGYSMEVLHREDPWAQVGVTRIDV